jgi:hypothetical protein
VWVAMRTAASRAVGIDLVMWSVAGTGARVGVGGVGTRWDAQGARESGCRVVGAYDDDKEQQQQEEEERGDSRRPWLLEVEIPSVRRRLCG